MAQTAPVPLSPTDAPKRPKGILKNSNSYQHSPPQPGLSPTATRPQPDDADVNGHAIEATVGTDRPPLPNRGMSEKEIVQMNTELNAGSGQRRNSSNPRGSMSRRTSGHGSASNSASETDAAEHEQRLKWDEANLYLNEGQMGGKMKIDEPKTPWAKHYDPSEEEDAVGSINAEDLTVDELDMEKVKRGGTTTKSRDTDIPGLELGEPEMDPLQRRESDGDKKVIVESGEAMDVDGGVGHGHGEDREEDMSKAELAKHRKFEEMRKKHYEMKNIKDLLGHSEELDEEEGENENGRR